MKKPAAKSGLKNRILEMRSMKAADLQSHPLNPRLHSPEQQAAIGQLLSSVGIADALLAFPADGLGAKGDFTKLMAYDGHCRKDLDPDQEWPVLVTDLTRAEADTMLAMLDHTAGLATIDPELARQLAASAKPAGLLPDAAWDAWAATMPEVPTPVESPADFPTVDENLPTDHECPKCGYKYSGGAASREAVEQ